MLGIWGAIRLCVLVAVLAGANWGISTASATDVNRAALTGVAIEGYDPVSYWVDGEPMAGSHAISLEWHGATWRFASESNRQLFLNDPYKYAPAFGGYCAYGIGRGIKADIHPYFWEIRNGHLYLFISQAARNWWRQDRRKLLPAAQRQWAMIGR